MTRPDPLPNPFYAIAHLREIAFGPEIADYLRAIDGTLAPFGGRFVIHGAVPETLEGAWPGDVVVIGFPDEASARGWYASPAYQAILPLRLRNSRGDVILVEGVEPDHSSVELLARIERRAAAATAG